MGEKKCKITLDVAAIRCSIKLMFTCDQFASDKCGMDQKYDTSFDTGVDQKTRSVQKQQSVAVSKVLKVLKLCGSLFNQVIYKIWGYKLEKCKRVGRRSDKEVDIRSALKTYDAVEIQTCMK